MFRNLLVMPAALTTILAMTAGAHAVNTADGNAYVDHPVTAVSKGPVTVTMGALTLGCDGAYADGLYHDGSSPYLTFSDLSLINCDGPGGTNADVTLDTSCANGGLTVHQTGPSTPGVDTAVAGVLNAGTSGSPCINVSTMGGLCQLDIYGSSSAVFNETVKPTNAQDLTISGNTLVVGGVSGLCPGVSNGNTVGLGITFNVISSSGAINL